MSDKKDKAAKRYQTFKDFYPFYLGEHSNRTCRRLHVIGTTFVLILVILAIVYMNPRFLYYTPIVGYGFAWVGHFFFEKNKPATFKYPIYSLMGDWVMWWETISGQRPF